jgi:hypothetical protein
MNGFHGNSSSRHFASEVVGLMPSRQMD